jgi:hopanoid biosynthesis associated protein HpnK
MPAQNPSARLLLDWRVRRLIVNADDFGLTAGVNRAIVQAHTQGIVTSSTLMATGSAFPDAVALAPATLSVGCHVLLVDGHPVLSRREIPSLASNGEFDSSLVSVVVRATTGRIADREIEAEASAQIRALQSAGVQVSHIDTHKHTHLFPQILRPLLRAAKACGVRAIRNPYGKLAWSEIASRPGLWKRYWQTQFLNVYAEKFRRAVSQAGIVTPDGSLGVVFTGTFDDHTFRLVLESIPEGTWELVCHPGYNDSDLNRIQTRLRHSRELELKLLTSPETRQILAEQGVQLISYPEL